MFKGIFNDNFLLKDTLKIMQFFGSAFLKPGNEA